MSRVLIKQIVDSVSFKAKCKGYSILTPLSRTNYIAGFFIGLDNWLVLVWVVAEMFLLLDAAYSIHLMPLSES